MIDGQLQFLRSPKLGVASMDGKAQLDLSEDPLENLDLSGDLGDLQLDISDLEKNLVISISSLADSNAQSEETGSSGSGQAQQQLEDRQRERFIGRLVKDLRRTVLTARKGAPEAIYLTGPGSQLPRVAEVLEEKFDVPVSTPEFLDHLPHQLGGSDPLRCNACLPSALGACFKLLGVDEGGAELRKEEFKFARKFEQIESVLMTGVSLLFVIALVLAFQFQNQARLAKGDYSDVLHEARQLRANRWWAKDPGWYNGTGKAPPEFLRSPVENQIVRLEDSLEDLKKLYDPNPTDEQSDIRPGLDVWFDVFEGLKQFVRDYPDQLILASFKIKGDDIFLQGKVANQSVESKLWDVVEGIAAKHSYMQRALQTTPPKPGKDGKLRINYRIVLKGARE